VKRSSVLAAALAAAISPGLGKRAVADEGPAVLRVGTGVSDTSSEVLYALELGLFKKRGLDVQVQQLPSGAAEVAAVAGGSLDIAESNVVSLAAAHLRGLPFVYIDPAAPYSSAAPTTVFICGKTSAFRTGKDINGKTIAVTALRDSSQLGPTAWTDKTGGDSSTLHFVELPMSEFAAAIGRGTIDAAPISEPLLHMALQAGGVRVFAKMFDAIAPQFMQNGWFTTTDWLKRNPGAAARFAEAIAEAAHWANRNHTASAQILKRYSRMPPDVVDTMVRATFAERLDPRLFQAIIDVSAKYKFIDRGFPAAEIIAG
jgi:NitT/TauT family transport system substrate-binding protein